MRRGLRVRRRAERLDRLAKGEVSSGTAEGTLDAGERRRRDAPRLRRAARELEEETGYRARVMTDLGWTYPNPAFMGNRFHVFLAEGCEPEGRVCLDEHELVDAFLVPVAEVREGMGKGQYSHALMVVALYLAERELASRPSAGL